VNDILLKTLNNYLGFQPGTLSSYKEKHLLENNIIQIIAQFRNQVTLNNEIYY